jgi:hypothetical protein
VWELPPPIIFHIAVGVFTFSLGAVAFVVISANGIRQWWVFRQWERGERPLPSTLAPSLETQPLSVPPPKETLHPVNIVEKKPQTLDSSELELLGPRPSTPTIPSSLTGVQATKLITELKPYSQDIQLKLCSTHEHMEFAKQLADVFRAAGYTFIIDEARYESIFSVQSTHNKIIIRYCEKNSSIHRLSCLCLSLILIPTFGILIDTNKFPQESNIDYFQIEVGGAP